MKEINFKDKNTLPKTYGVYKITCLVNNKVYIGSSINLYSRLNSHKSKLNKNKGNINLQKDFNKYKINNFTFTTLETNKSINKYEIYKKEEYYINKYKSNKIEFGYNISNVSENGNNIFSVETKIKISQSRIGTKMSDSTKERISIANKNKKPTQYAINCAVKSREKTATLISPDNKIFKITNISKFCREYNLNQSCISDLINKKRKHHKNWRLYNDSET